MLPNDALSVEPVIGAFLFPDNLVDDFDEDFELGPFDINDASSGLEVQAWRLLIQGNNIDIQKHPGGAFVTLLTVPGVTQASFAFDQNAEVSVVYTVGSEVFLWWIDPTLPGRRTTLIANAVNPRLGLDDKREISTASSDIILAYQVGTDLRYRQQRDRYTIERTLMSGIEPGIRLRNIGMTNVFRVQFEFVR
ncbi:hypothetical protein [Nevskia sp.]|uniref:hypothetical protein n=1 Tax=Nevskia sp. TaxID=1929292 RepID=UPI0025F12AFB|nr:hypothetical protein [Nevskia sp.]